MFLYDKIIVIDIEATCWENGIVPHNQRKEIIEIGVCKLTMFDGTITDKRSYYIKPQRSEISSYCTELTGITNEKLQAEGISFSDAIRKIKNKYNTKVRTYAGYGEFDREIIEGQCQEYNIINPFSNTYLDVKVLFSLINNKEKPLGLLQEMNFYKIPFEGNAHSGADDAYNTAKLLYHILKKK